MVDIRPFKAISYTPKAGPIEDLITQPYDKIDLEMQKQYYDMSPYNFCRIILPIESDKYNTANQRISGWLEEGIMAKESQPAFYVSRQDFTLHGKSISRSGIIAAVKLHPYSENIVFPHEATFKAPKSDRLNMLRVLQKDLEPVFLMYQDPEEKTIAYMAEVTKNKPVIETTDSLGVKHTVWKVSDPDKIAEIRSLIAPKVVVINDGHHRYESAVLYRDEIRSRGDWSEDQAFNYYMCYMVPVQENGLVVLPTHRLLKNYRLTTDVVDGLKCFFMVSEIDPTVKSIKDFLVSHISEHAFCAYDGTKACGLILKHDPSIYDFITKTVSNETKVFDVVILRDIVFKQVLKTEKLKIDDNIFYERWVKDAVAKVDNDEASIAFFVNPIKAETIAEVAVQHEVLPEKSTDFYPKLVSGLV
ncbi:MAG: DUF1015 domain-containing protein, partial [Crenarchaeota archaeon]|nr:DUF1015 domain-containing protein [Thermoproteota archaeon]